MSLLSQIVRIFPNPVNDQLTILTETPRDFHLQLIASDGRIMLTERFNGNHRINLGHLPRGLYMLKLSSEEAAYIEKVYKR